MVVYDHGGKLVLMNWPAIRGLKRLKTSLTTRIVDFVLSCLFLQQPQEIQRDLNILSSMAMAAVGEGFHSSKEAIQSFVDSHALASFPKRTHEVKELLVVWIYGGHSLLLVF